MIPPNSAPAQALCDSSCSSQNVILAASKVPFDQESKQEMKQMQLPDSTFLLVAFRIPEPEFWLNGSPSESPSDRQGRQHLDGMKTFERRLTLLGPKERVLPREIAFAPDNPDDEVAPYHSNFGVQRVRVQVCRTLGCTSRPET